MHKLSLNNPTLLYIAIIIILLVEAVLLGQWLIDDAAISLAYANNLASGNGLTAQLGSSPVEGFSNPLLVFLLVSVSWLDNPVLILKSLSFASIMLTTWLLIFTKDLSSNSTLALRWAMVFLITQPSIIIWCFSGLENHLSLLFATVILIQSLKYTEGHNSDPLFYKAGFAAAALTLCRPEGVLYLLVFPSLIMLLQSNSSVKMRNLLLVIALPLVTWISYSVFRLIYFDSVVPNTFVAKGGPTIDSIVQTLTFNQDTMLKMLDFFESIFGSVFKTWILIALIVFGWLTVKRGSKAILAPLFIAFLGLLIYLVYPYDWMPEFRFATIAFLGIYVTITFIFFSLVIPKWRWLIIPLVFTHSGLHAQRFISFINYPPISVQEVQATGNRLLQWGQQLGINNVSVLTADIGGMLLQDRVQVVDLGMLTDHVIAESLGEGSNMISHDRFLNYIFEEKKPDFIATRAYHSWLADFDKDSRFRDLYSPVFEYDDNWIRTRYGASRKSGDYVRKDLELNNQKQLESMRLEATKLYYPGCLHCPPFVRAY